MNAAWIDTWLPVLNDRIKVQARGAWSLFDPTTEFYAKLESGDEDDLEAATLETAGHISLREAPTVTYEWGLKMKPEAAGQIRMSKGRRSHIQIPLFYVGKPHALGAILAHELSHEFLAQIGVWHENLEENERLTDLASIAIGLGKLVLNGSVAEAGFATGYKEILGYLTLHQKIYAYWQISKQHSIPIERAKEHLTDEAILHLPSSATVHPVNDEQVNETRPSTQQKE
jgi:hypothetical protein